MNGLFRTRRVLRLAFAGFALALVAGAPGSAFAQAAPEEAAGVQRPASHERRAGAVVGTSLGFALGGGHGYPNDLEQKGDPAFYTSTPVLAGYSTTFFLQGAFSDYVSFGPMVNVATFDTASWKSTGLGVGFRGDLYPFVRIAPVLADLAIYGQVGFGKTELRYKGPYPVAEGAQSFYGLGVHHELLRMKALGGHFAAGPHLEWDLVDSQTATRTWATAGFRLAFFGGATKADAR